MSRFAQRLAQGPLQLDAAMGTALIARGFVPSGGPASALNLTHPEWVRAVHASQVAAGAQVLLTNTFGGAAPGEAALIAGLAIAHEAAQDGALVALSLFAGLPGREVERCVREALVSPHPPDAIWLETAISESSAREALAAAGRALPVAVTLSCTALAADWRPVLRALEREGASLLGFNCSPWPHEPQGLASLARSLRDTVQVPLVLKPDAGPLPPAAWADRLAAAARAAPLSIGGCCGTTDAHLSHLRAALESSPPGGALQYTR